MRRISARPARLKRRGRGGSAELCRVPDRGGTANAANASLRTLDWLPRAYRRCLFPRHVLDRHRRDNRRQRVRLCVLPGDRGACDLGSRNERCEIPRCDGLVATSHGGPLLSWCRPGCAQSADLLFAREGVTTKTPHSQPRATSVRPCVAEEGNEHARKTADLQRPLEAL